MWSEELRASTIAARFNDVSRPAVSQHLGVLREAGLVTERREGTRRFYRANRDEMARLRAFLDDYWTGWTRASAGRGRGRAARPPRATTTGADRAERPVR